MAESGQFAVDAPQGLLEYIGYIGAIRYSRVGMRGVDLKGEGA